MPAYLYWGEDEYRLAQAVQGLRDRLLDANWASFNYDKIELTSGSEQTEAVIQGLNQMMTAPFGVGDRLVWLANVPLCQRCSEELLLELERTLPALPKTSHLLLTNSAKPDGRSKVTKLFQKYAEIQEFSPISPWKTEQLVQQVKLAARQVGVKLTQDAVELLAESVGNDTRQLYGELEKLRLYATASPSKDAPLLNAVLVASLVAVTTQNSLQLADAIRQGDTNQALILVTELINQNEPSLRIVATLTKQFRTWLWVKLMTEAGERDERLIAQAAEVGNPKRVYFLQRDVQRLSVKQLQQVLPLLLDLEVSLKQGGEAIATLQTKVIELCQLCYCNHSLK